MSVKQEVAKETGTKARDWEFIDGPETGVGVEFWLRNSTTKQEAYYCDDQGSVSISVDEYKECPDCGEPLKTAMQDLDGTNLEEGLECQNPDCLGRE
ncbi:MAG: hypothetical protein WC341_13830 [Bacteroidales bacterium]